MYSFFYGTFGSRARLRITLTVGDEQHISRGWSSPTNTTIAHTHCGTKGNELKRKWEREREARHCQLEYKKEEARLEVRKFKIIAKQAAIILIWST